MYIKVERAIAVQLFNSRTISRLPIFEREYETEFLWQSFAICIILAYQVIYRFTLRADVYNLLARTTSS